MPEEKDIAVKIDGLSKNFKLPHERKNSLKEWVLHFHNPSYEELQALEDINFEVKKGEFFGIVGRNGSGKSTLLKIIGGIYQPTKGKVTVNGTLTPFIELGIGFNPELTGRENVYLNGAILGLTRKEVNKLYQEIVDFAELEKFMDQKLKNYSSGMQVRLAFSIAIQAHNDILLIDEVLAVGDASFQRKCYSVFNDIKKSNKTVIFVTHDMGAIQQFCDRAVMIEDSKILAIGSPRNVALRYEVANSIQAPPESGETESEITKKENSEIELLSIKTRDKHKKTKNFSFDETIIVDVNFKIKKLNQPVQFNLYLVKPNGEYLAGFNSTRDIGEYMPKKGEYQLTCQIKASQLVKGDYFVNIAVYTYSEPAKLIDLLDISYKAKVPRITILESSKSQNGQFNMQGKWIESRSINEQT